ncbi:hypothetical protein [Pseudomonas taiwanensis]|uniref:Uncharacterized protein n=1 Tax=Pseudomonas taiwanensis SJ9 TaxID=1388762 RepID=V7D832_9PSED|nr:hypothetical protein [Pseudomonas taiwanensis]ESW38512.1 hypothetical protein O164_17425 [Pseudomonas taiwanensis SJ9]
MNDSVIPKNGDPFEVVSYFVTDQQHVVIQSGTSQRLHLNDHAQNGRLHLGTAPHGRFKYINGEFEPYTPDVSYDLARRDGYPPIEEQLDMLWHAMDQGAMPKAEPFYTTLQRVKQQHPKT